jgi:PAS domain S-box-containing protein
MYLQLFSWMKKDTKISASDSRAGESADQFRLIVEAILDYAIFMLDAGGHVKTWTAGAERIKGYKASEIIGKHFAIFYPEEDKSAGKPAWELEVAEREGRFEDEGWRLRKDGSRFWANVVITAIRDERGKLIGFGKITRDFTERRAHEQRLAESEERFRLLVEGVPDYAIYMMDPEGRVTTWNSGAERIKGYTASEIIGRHYSTFFPQEDVRAGKPQKILKAAAEEGKVEQEGWRIRKDGSRFWVNALVTALHDKSGELVGFSKITRDATEKMQHQKALETEVAERKRAEEELVKSEASLRKLSLSLLRMQDEERRRIGREMHDSVGQYLTALKMNLGILSVKEPNLSPETREELRTSTEMLEECVKEVRTISYLLYPPMLEEMGLKSAISWYLDGLKQRSEIEIRFNAPKNFKRLDRGVELALFRVLQEGLTNVYKHSGTSKVDIELSRSNGVVTLELRDYGKGVPPAILAEREGNVAGVGLRGMNERMRQLGGKLTIAAAKPGTLVQATVPAQDEPELKIGS